MNELAHHGIAGQKWGVRHGPPYPLSRQKRYGGTAENPPAESKKTERTLTELLFKKRLPARFKQLKLNKLEQKRANLQSNVDYRRAKYKKAKKYFNDTFVERSSERKLKEAEKNRNEQRKKIDNYIKQLNKEGYEVNSKNFVRLADDGKRYFFAYATSASTLEFLLRSGIQLLYDNAHKRTFQLSKLYFVNDKDLLEKKKK